MSETIKYPEVQVQLSGQDGNAFAIMAAVTTEMGRWLRENTEMTPSEIGAEKDAFRTEAMSGDYDNLLRTAMRWVAVS